MADIHTCVCAGLVEGLFPFSELDRNSGIHFDCCIGYRGGMGSPDSQRLLVEIVGCLGIRDPNPSPDGFVYKYHLFEGILSSNALLLQSRQW